MKIERKLKPLEKYEQTIKDKKTKDKSSIKILDVFEYLDALNDKLDEV